jgi:phosphatidylglycerol:prolipoprotein diacylglycerol transferase
MLALGVVLGVLVAERLAKQQGIKQETILDLSIIGVIAGLIGSRLFYVIFYDWDYYRHHILQIFDLRNQGLVFYGSFIVGGLVILCYVGFKRLNFWKLADVLAPGLAVGYAVGRLGCFLNGCCFGKPTALPWGVVFPTLDPVPRHPTQIYEFLLNLGFFALLYLWFPKRKFDGQVFLFYVLGYAFLRFMIEFLRENLVVWHGLTIAQVTALGMAVVAIPLYWWLRSRAKARPVVPRES